MVLLTDRGPSGYLPDVWASLKASAAANPDVPTVLLLVALDVDALSACAILMRLLEAEQIPHKVKPVSDYRNLGDIYVEQIASSTELRSIVMLNCGGIVDLMDHLQTRLNQEDEGSGEAPRLSTELPHPECKWYILDSHRPYNLNNVIEDDGRVNLLDDGEPNMDMDELVQQTHIMQDIEDEGYEEDE